METTKKIKRVNKDEPTGFDRFNRVSKGANAVLNIIFIIMSLLCVIPILLVVAISFSAEDSITEYGYRFIPKIFSLEGYTFLASQSTMLLRALGVSLFVTIVGTVLGVMLTTLMGLMAMKRNLLQPTRGFRSKIFRPMVSSLCLPLTALLPIMITTATEWDYNICSARSLPSRSACRYA